MKTIIIIGLLLIENLFASSNVIELLNAEKYQEGASLAKKECFQGNKSSCAVLGHLLIEGKYIPSDIEKGVKYSKMACKAKITFSCNLLGDTFYNYNGDKLKSDMGHGYKLAKHKYIEQAAGFYHATCILVSIDNKKLDKIKHSCEKAINIYYNELPEIAFTHPKRTAISHATEYCNKYNNAYACNFLGNIKYKESDKSKIGSYYWKSTLKDAQSYYQKACKYGDKRACNKSDEIDKKIFEAF